MKFLLLVLAILLTACSTSRPAAWSGGESIGKQAAVSIAKEEIARRHITLPPGTTIRVIEDEIILEFRPAVPVYAVSFYGPDPKRSIPLYSVSVHRRTGKIYSVTDTHVIIRGGR